MVKKYLQTYSIEDFRLTLFTRFSQKTYRNAKLGNLKCDQINSPTLCETSETNVDDTTAMIVLILSRPTSRSDRSLPINKTVPINNIHRSNLL